MAEQTEEITAKEFGNAARSKKEAYDVLTVQGDYYLPPIESTRADFVADILIGNKKVIKCNKVIVKLVPQIDGLRTNQIIEFAQTLFDIRSYFPEGKKEVIVPPRPFVCNLVNSLFPKEFSEFIDNALENREKVFINKKSLKIVAKPEFARLFKHPKVESSKNFD